MNIFITNLPITGEPMLGAVAAFLPFMIYDCVMSP